MKKSFYEFDWRKGELLLGAALRIYDRLNNKNPRVFPGNSVNKKIKLIRFLKYLKGDHFGLFSTPGSKFKEMFNVKYEDYESLIDLGPRDVAISHDDAEKKARFLLEYLPVDKQTPERFLELVDVVKNAYSMRRGEKDYPDDSNIAVAIYYAKDELIRKNLIELKL